MRDLIGKHFRGSGDERGPYRLRAVVADWHSLWRIPARARLQSSRGPSLASRAAVKTRAVVRYVAVSLACACATACSGSSPSPIFTSTTGDGGAAERGDGAPAMTDASGLTGTDAYASDDEGDDGWGGSGGDAADDATNAAPNSDSSQYCCVSGAYYVCPTAGVFAQCTSACTRDPSRDATCARSRGGSGPGLPPPPTNACGGPFTGFSCGAGGQCNGLGHCAQNLCFPNDVGNPCTYPDECGDGNHCTNGCCASPAKGSACNAFWDCDSGTCNNGVCQ
jgi:hypothetical protein